MDLYSHFSVRIYELAQLDASCLIIFVIVLVSIPVYREASGFIFVQSLIQSIAGLNGRGLKLMTHLSHCREVKCMEPCLRYPYTL